MTVNYSGKAVLFVGQSRADWWKTTMNGLLPGIEFVLWNDDFDPAEIQYAIVWRPPDGWLRQFQNLRCIISIGAGVDHVLCDPELPREIPLLRTTGDELRVRMREYVVLHVLRFHRRLPELEEANRGGVWRQIIEPPASERRVGMMGLGFMGRYCVEALNRLDFQVFGWSRSPKQIEGVTCYAGISELREFLTQVEILVCLLPLTKETEGILNHELFEQLPKDASLINAGRGEHLVEEDLLTALDSGKIHRATLDVFHEEPLPPRHPFWTHPRILITPHVASLIDPLSGGKRIAENLRCFVAGKPVADLVDIRKGY